MSVLLIDFEATGIDPKTVRPLEVGAMVVSDDFQHIHHTYNQMVYEEGYPELTAEVEKVTGISLELLKLEGKPARGVMKDVCNIILTRDDIKFIVAYNRSYDEVLFNEELKRHGMELEMKWLCAMRDVEKNYEFKSWKLMHVALDHGVAINPKELHRAIADVEVMRKMLIAAGETAQSLYAYQTEPSMYIRAIVQKPWEDDGKSTDLAKARGFSWERVKGDPDAKHFPKSWVKKIKAKNFEQEEKACSFTIRVIS